MAVLQDRHSIQAVWSTPAHVARLVAGTCASKTKVRAVREIHKAEEGGKVEVTVKVGGVCGVALHRVIMLSALLMYGWW